MSNLFFSAQIVAFAAACGACAYLLASNLNEAGHVAPATAIHGPATMSGKSGVSRDGLPGATRMRALKPK
jgi:hypothetical protein